MDWLHRASGRAQAWLLQRPGALSSALLTAFYNVELLVYAPDPHRFLEGRQRALGRTFAALGRLFVTDHGGASWLLAQPHKRGHLLAAGRTAAERFPADFPLFLDDREAGGDGRHEVLHRWLFERWLEPARERLDDPALAAIVDEGVRALAALPRPLTEASVRPAVNRMVIRYMTRALLELDPDEQRLQALTDLAFSEARRDNYFASAIYPMLPPGFALKRLRARVEDLAAWMASSPLFDGWTPGPDNGELTRGRLGELLLSLMLIAALGGSANVAVNLLVRPGSDVRVDPEDRRAVLGAVLEAARIKPPVNEVNSVLLQPRGFELEGRPVTFPAGTLVAACLARACLDERVFPEPTRFDPRRENLERDVLSFNAVGFHPETRPDARRACPGRNVAARFLSDLWVASHRAGVRAS